MALEDHAHAAARDLADDLVALRRRRARRRRARSPAAARGAPRGPASSSLWRMLFSSFTSGLLRPREQGVHPRPERRHASGRSAGPGRRRGRVALPGGAAPGDAAATDAGACSQSSRSVPQPRRAPARANRGPRAPRRARLGSGCPVPVGRGPGVRGERLLVEPRRRREVPRLVGDLGEQRPLRRVRRPVLAREHRRGAARAPARAAPGVGEQAVEPGSFGLQRPRRPQGDDGGGEVAALEEGDAEVAPGLRVLRVEPDRLAEGGRSPRRSGRDGRKQPTHVDEGVDVLGSSRRVSRYSGDGALEVTLIRERPGRG